jgi:hypothetical protein
MGNPVHQEHVDHRVSLVHQAKLEVLEHQANQVLMVLKE